MPASGVSTSFVNGSCNARVWKSLNLIIIYESIFWKHCRQCAWKYTVDALTFCSETFSNSLTWIHHTNSERHQNYIDIRRVFFSFSIIARDSMNDSMSIHSFRLQIVYLHYSHISNRSIEKKKFENALKRPVKKIRETWTILTTTVILLIYPLSPILLENYRTILHLRSYRV